MTKQIFSSQLFCQSMTRNIIKRVESEAVEIRRLMLTPLIQLMCIQGITSTHWTTKLPERGRVCVLVYILRVFSAHPLPYVCHPWSLGRLQGSGRGTEFNGTQAFCENSPAAPEWLLAARWGVRPWSSLWPLGRSPWSCPSSAPKFSSSLCLLPRGPLHLPQTPALIITRWIPGTLPRQQESVNGL